jgi:hypothetical protein
MTLGMVQIRLRLVYVDVQLRRTRKEAMVGRTEPTRRLDVELIRQPLARRRASRLELSANFYRK